MGNCIKQIIDGVDYSNVHPINKGTTQGQIVFWDATLGKWTYAETSEITWEDSQKYLQVGDTNNVIISAGQISTETSNNAEVFSGLASGITSSDIFSFIQEDSAFAGNGIYLSFGEEGGSFTGNFLNFENALDTKFKVDKDGDIIIADNSTIGSVSDPDIMTLGADGVTTFSVFPISPSAAPTTDYQFANKKYVDDNIFSSPLTTKGDLLTYDITEARLPLGTDGYVLTADSTQSTGIKWAAAAGGGNTEDGTAAGQMLFWDVTSEYKHTETSELFWDDTNKWLGIGTSTPNNKFEVAGLVCFDPTSKNVALGTEFEDITIGTSNVAIGEGSMIDNTEGIDNVAIGQNALSKNTTGDYNFALGRNALTANTTGSRNTAIGRSALVSNVTTQENVAIGYFSLKNCLNSNNVAIGTNSGFTLSSGRRNTFIGDSAGYGTGADPDENTGIGRRALFSIQGNYNTAVGHIAGNALTSAEGCIFLGRAAGARQTTTSNLLIIDNQLRADAATELTNSIIYGTMAAAPANQDLRINAQVGINLTPTAYLTLPAGTATANTAPLKFTAGIALTTPEVGAVEFHDSRLWVTNIATRRAIDRSSGTLISTVTVENTTTETTVLTETIPANGFKTGNMAKLHLSGIFSTANASQVATIRIKIGSTTIATLDSPAKTLTDACFNINGIATVRGEGASVDLAYHIDTSAEDNTSEDCDIVSIDTTASNTISVTVQWNNALAGNIFNATQGILEFKN